jgi:hypothetical protein
MFRPSKLTLLRVNLKVETDFINSITVRPDKGNNKITELRTILQRESQNS